MFQKKQDCPSPKPDPPEIFTRKVILEISICLLLMLFCVFTVDYIDSNIWHEEHIQKTYYLDMDLECDKK